MHSFMRSLRNSDPEGQSKYDNSGLLVNFVAIKVINLCG